jgi:hypothetical protein
VNQLWNPTTATTATTNSKAVATTGLIAFLLNTILKYILIHNLIVINYY